MKTLNRIGFLLVLSAVLAGMGCGSTADDGEAPDVRTANPDATDEVREVLAYLHEIEGEYILAGQEENNQSTSSQDEKVFRITGKRPALRGFETAAYSTDPISAAILAWRRDGQLVTFSYHMGAPLLSDERFQYSKESADVRAAVTEGTPEHEALMAKLDAMAERLQRLEDAGVPLLWRPWHEMDGTWFWWSSDGCDPFRDLWRLTFDYFTVEKQLDNLIWVWSGDKEPGACWYPGDAYVDLIGSDTYFDEPDHDRWARIYDELQEIADMPAAITENDHIPHPDSLFARDAPYLWFLTWHSQWLDENPEERLRAVYTHDRVITADELPEF